MTSARVVETSVNVISNRPSQDYTNRHDLTSLNYDMISGFQPFTIAQYISRFGPAFRPLSCTPPCSRGTALTGVGVDANMPLGGIAGVLVCAVIFFVSAATSKKLKTKDSKHAN